MDAQHAGLRRPEVGWGGGVPRGGGPFAGCYLPPANQAAQLGRSPARTILAHDHVDLAVREKDRAAVRRIALAVEDDQPAVVVVDRALHNPVALREAGLVEGEGLGAAVVCGPCDVLELPPVLARGARAWGPAISLEGCDRGWVDGEISRHVGRLWRAHARELVGGGVAAAWREQDDARPDQDRDPSQPHETRSWAGARGMSSVPVLRLWVGGEDELPFAALHAGQFALIMARNVP